MYVRIQSQPRSSLRSSLGTIVAFAVAASLGLALEAEPLPPLSGREPFILSAVPSCPESGTPTLHIGGRFLAKADKLGQPILPKVTLGEDPRSLVNLVVTDFGFDFIDVELPPCAPGTFLLTVQTATNSKDVEYDLFELTLGAQSGGPPSGLDIVYVPANGTIQCPGGSCDATLVATCDSGFNRLALVSCSAPDEGDLIAEMIFNASRNDEIGCRFIGGVAEDEAEVEVVILCIEQGS